MKGYSVYNAIQQLKEKGFSKASVAKQLNRNRRTVIRYWNMSVEEYEQKYLGLCREKALDTYRNQIISWLRAYPTLTAAQGCDWLKEHYHEQFAGRTVSRYVKALREEYRLKKSVRPRDYEAVPELPIGQQIKSTENSWYLFAVDIAGSSIQPSLQIIGGRVFKSRHQPHFHKQISAK